ncbi:MAG: hypothetical protein AVDCRST_MAG77-4321 [uncultured Chloroflexi bacterium]|uniref:Uncharacterized protein n=1 Tax=uncultured Chloroflexota bacterium TaxID=166587 RepID=A0A6J4JKB3_9CHLR|nr:MAG: hypothetical protein AVDCRST_MAG77-4321 [uncultured Chloroflexota bacterium]
MGLLDKLTAPFKGIADWQKQQAAAAAERNRAEEEQHQARRDAYMKEIMEEWAGAERVEPKPYRELSIGESKVGRIPAVEYFLNTAAVRLHHLMPGDMMRQAALIDALGMQLDGLEEGEIGDVIDVKPKDMAAIEHGAVNLGPVPEFKNAEGTRWRFFLELSYSAATGSGRGGIQTRYFIADCTL